MASFADLAANLKLNISDFSAKLNEASQQARRFSRNLNGQLNDSSDALADLNRSTNAWGLNLKSVSRVVSGIVISQAFYTMLQDIQTATNAVWEFSKQLEYAHIAYSNLFGDTSLSAEFINVLKDFAAKTPFTFTEAESAAKRLISYGIEYKNIMYVMQGVLSAAAMQGDPTKIESISRALGQIYTYGKLMTAEVRQLAEAGIPAYEILQEELGLTQDQLRNLGNEAIPASVAINALVDGMQKRFGNVVTASSRTITGIISNIKDNATMLAAGLVEPMVVFIKSGLSEVGEILFNLRDIMETSGAGGVFEALFPPELHESLRQFVANLQAVFQSIARLGLALGNLLGPAVMAVVNVFNMFGPMLASLVNTIASLIYMVTSNADAMRKLTIALTVAAAAWVLFKINALAASITAGVITLISKSLAGLSTMLTFVVAHPFWSLLIGLGALFLGISGGFGKLKDSVSSFFNQLNQFNKVDPDKVLLPSQKDRANDLDKFNEKLEGTSDAMDDLAGSTGKAAKAAKSLLSFDEVFKLKDPDEGAGSGGISDETLEELTEMLAGISGGGYIPEVPDFSDYMNELKEGFLGDFTDTWNEIGITIPSIVSTALGAGFGRVLGTLFGGKFGGIIGTLVGGIAGYFWNRLADTFNLTPEEKAKAGIITGVGAGLGAILGGLLGGPVGAKLGVVIGTVVGGIWGIFAEHFGITDTQHISTVIGGALQGAFVGALQFLRNVIPNLVPTYIDDAFTGFATMASFSLKNALSGALKAGVIGAIVGIGVGILSNALAGWIVDELGLTEQALENAGVGQMIGNVIGSVIGMIFGGPLGALIGGSIGQLAGSAIGALWETMSDTVKGIVLGGAAGTPIGALVGVLVGSIGGPLGAALGAVIGTAIGAIVGVIVDNWESISAWWADTKEGFDTWVEDTGTKFSDWWSDTKTGFTDWKTETEEKLATWWSDTETGFTDWKTETGEKLSTWWSDTKTGFTDWKTETGEKLSTWWSDTKTGFTDWKTETGEKLSTWWSDTKTGFTDWKRDTGEKLSTWWSDTKGGFTSWKRDTGEKLSTWWSDTETGFTGWKRETSEKLSTWFTDTKGGFTSWKRDTGEKLSTWWSDTKKGFSDWCTETGKELSTWFTDLKTDIKDWWSNSWIVTSWKSGWSHVSEWFSDLFDDIRGWFSSIGDSINSWWNNLWSDKEASVSVDGDVYTAGGGGRAGSGSRMVGHATGGIFDREHIARFAEGNKAEAIIPLENATAMQPFVNAVSQGIIEGLAPTLVQLNGTAGNNLPPLYVGTLVADDRGLKQLYKKFEIIQVQENARKGLV